MKKPLYIMIAVFILLTVNTFSQVGINTDGSNPDNSAMLDVKSSSKGLLPPRMTTSEIMAIASPAAGLMVYNTSANEMAYYNGTNWRWFNGDPMFYIGQSYGGGVIFYVDGTGHHGLISATSDQSTSGEWGCFGTYVVGAGGHAIGDGQPNTTAIVTDGCASVNSAAKICDNLVLGGYSDWFLPSVNEIIQMYIYKTQIGGFSGNYYWTSSEEDFYYAHYIRFSDGYETIQGKDNLHSVRACRAF